MKGFQTLALLLLGVAAHARPERDGRVLSIFSVVNFENLECEATINQNGGARSGLMGTCLSATECSDTNGEHKGNCAAGFGVCCVRQVKACGGTISNNNTYISNVDYPTVLAAGTVDCAYTIARISGDDICQVRLDFQDVVLTPGTNGALAAADSKIVAAGGSGIEPPSVSGAITGDHMYVEVVGMDPTVTINTAAAATGQKWNIQVSQIACNSPYKAPKDCTQYFTENTGTVRSFNTREAASMQSLVSQAQRICIRQNEGMCGARFTASTFAVGMANTGTNAGSTGATCGALAGQIVIPGSGVFCENRLSITEDDVVNAPVTVKNGPVSLFFTTTTTATASADGFVLNYIQV